MGYICPECDKSAESNVIQCNTCEYWFHYSCSKLPVHYLFLLIQEKRIPYYCELCVHQKYKKEYPLQHVSLEKIIDSQSFSNRAMPNQTDDSFEIENDDKTDMPPTNPGNTSGTGTGRKNIAQSKDPPRDPISITSTNQNNRDGQVIDDESKEENDNVKKDTHCKYYLSGKCNHGRRGQGCPYTHPKLCFNFLKKGAAGCNKSDCEYTHPKLCKYSVSDKMCRRRKCHFYHLWGTKRPNIETNYQGDNNHISDYNQEEHKPYRKPANLNNNARPQQNRYDLQSGERYDFLEEFAQILQEKLSVYYQQAERKPYDRPYQIRSRRNHIPR